MQAIVIIGSGLAGYTLAKELRKLASEPPLHIITRDDGAFYSKPMLSNALAKAKTAENLATASAEQMAAQLKATIWTHSEVTAIDAAAHTVTARGVTFGYDKLVLAVGAEPIRPPLAGDGAAAVYAVNNLADYARFRQGIERARRVAVIGPGLIGCEFANDLVQAGKAVTVIGPAATPLDRLLPPLAGQALQKALAAAGVEWRLGLTAQRVDRRGDALSLQLSDGSVVEADAMLSAIGLRPLTALAQAAGIKVNRGIAVDRHLEGSLPGIFALGDCAEVEGLVLPFVMPIMQAARALAQTLTGKRTAVSYPAMPVVVKTPAYAVVVSPPPLGGEGRWEVSGDERGIHALYRDANNKLLGFALTGTATTDKQSLTRELPPWLD
jgi:rubredoxin-NAD+ reductase